MPTAVPDEAFIRYFENGDRAAFARFFDGTVDHLLGAAQRMARDRHAAEDLVQSTYLAAIEHAETFDRDQRVLPWLLGILHNRARRDHRTQQRHPDPCRVAAVPQPGPEDETRARELRSSLHDAIASLDEPFRRVVALHLEQGLAAGQIATHLDRPRATVRTQLMRGLRRLRRRLGPAYRDLAVPPSSPADLREALLRAAAERTGDAALTGAAKAGASAAARWLALAASLAVGLGAGFLIGEGVGPAEGTGAGSRVMSRSRHLDWARGLARGPMDDLYKYSPSFFLELFDAPTDPVLWAGMRRIATYIIETPVLERRAGRAAQAVAYLDALRPPDPAFFERLLPELRRISRR